MSTTTSNHWQIHAKQRNGGEVYFDVTGAEYDEAGVRAHFEASHGKLYEILDATPNGDGRSDLFVTPTYVPPPVQEVAAFALPAIPVFAPATVPAPLPSVEPAHDEAEGEGD
jgi:hypothetical protein